MNEKILKEIRKRAEASVSDMQAGDIRLKAFEIIFEKLIADHKMESNGRGKVHTMHTVAHVAGTTGKNRPSGPTANALRLKEEGFFKTPKSLGEIVKALAEMGFHYPATTISVILVRLTRQKVLRRVIVGKGKRGYKYTNW